MTTVLMGDVSVNISAYNFSTYTNSNSGTNANYSIDVSTSLTIGDFFVRYSTYGDMSSAASLNQIGGKIGYYIEPSDDGVANSGDIVEFQWFLGPATGNISGTKLQYTPNGDGTFNIDDLVSPPSYSFVPDLFFTKLSALALSALNSRTGLIDNYSSVGGNQSTYGTENMNTAVLRALLLNMESDTNNTSSSNAGSIETDLNNFVTNGVISSSPSINSWSISATPTQKTNVVKDIIGYLLTNVSAVQTAGGITFRFNVTYPVISNLTSQSRTVIIDFSS